MKINLVILRYRAKPHPIFIQAQIIDPLIKVLEQQADSNNFVLKQLKDNQIRLQLNTPELYKK